MKNSVYNIDYQLCTGCKMCADLCPKNAIAFNEGKEGFWYPTVDEKVCVNCGLCKEKCPAITPFRKEDNHEPDVYALWSKNNETRITSTSGGVFWEFAECFILNGGVVVGSRYGDDWRSAYHAIAATVDELKALKGSKYFQSDTSGIYKKTKSFLEKGIDVLFCGSPCQIAALYSYLKKQYDNLYTMDFICRSINSPKAFKAYIDELEDKFGSKVSEVHLKDKTNGWQSLASRVTFEDGQVSLEDKSSDYWVRGFLLNDLFTRKSCYHCQYRVIPRAAADLTMGDFWGIRHQEQIDMFKGISVLLVNSDKGKALFKNVCDRFHYTEHSMTEVLPGNPALLKSPVRTAKQDKFFELINSGTCFSSAVSACIESKKPIILKKIWRKIRAIKSLFSKGISIPKFIYYNYFCIHIQRTNGAKVLPHKNAIINFGKGSKIILSGGNLEIGFNKLKGSRSETHIRMNDNATWLCKDGGLLFYDTVLEIKKNAVFETGFFSMNGGSVIIVHKKVTFGDDVMIGRNVIIYDSDFHTLYNRNYKAVNIPKPVTIEDHVWLTTNVMVQKGVTIGRDSLIAAYTVVNKNVPPHSIIGGKASGEVIKDWVHWDRRTCPME